MQYTKYLRWGTLASLFLILIIPFVIANGTLFPNLFFPFITGKNFAFRVLVELALGFYILLALREPKYRPKSSLVMWALGLFVAWVGISTITSVDGVKSFWSNYERMDGYITLLHMGVLAVIAGATLSVENLWDRFFKTSVAVSAVQGIYAFLQVTHLLGFTPSSQSGARADTSFGNATYLAVYMLFNVFITLYLLVREKHSKLMQSLYGIALVLQFGGLYFTETRGALLGAIGGLIVASLYMAFAGRESQFKTLRTWSLGFLAAIVVLAGIFFAIRDTSFIKSSSTLNRLASISLQDKTTYSRFYIWNMAYKGSLEKPITGWGQENFNYVFNKYYDPVLYDQEQWFDRAHNQFLDWLIAGGIPAFALYISLFALAAWAILRSTLSVPERAVLLGLLAGYAFNNLFVFDNLTSAFYFFFILAFAHSLSRRPLPAWMFMSRPVGDHGVAIAAPVVILGVLVGGLALNAPAYARASALVTAVTPYVPVTGSDGKVSATSKDPKQNIQEFQAALAIDVWPGSALGKQETVEQVLQYVSNTIAPSASVSPDVKQLAYSFAHDASDALLLARPNDARLELFVGSYLSAFGNNTEALQHIEKALAASPKKQQVLIQLGLTYIQIGENKKAVEVLKEAYDLAPQYESAVILYAAALYKDNQQAAGDAVLTERFGSTIADNDQLVNVYTNTKQWSRLIAIWKLRVENSPEDANVLLGLASAYFTSGDTKNTIATLQKVAELNPAFAGQAQQIIKQIQDGTLKTQ